MNFIEFRDKINTQFNSMSSGPLFRTGIDKDKLWETYLNSFPEGSNPIFRERTEHDCQCCKQFIRACGDVVQINADLTITSIWDITTDDPYDEVSTTMSNLVRSQPVQDHFLHWQPAIGTKQSHDFHRIGTSYDHFYFDLPNRFVNTRDLDTVLSKVRSDKDVFLRGLGEISLEAIDTVLELIAQDTIYRGDEHRGAIISFKKLYQQSYGELEQDTLVELVNFAWLNAAKPGARIRNTAIGTLLIDISEGMDLDKAVRLFESKMYNYKRPTAVISPMMIAKAQDKITTLGFLDSLKRRNAQLDDLTINNVLFADRTTRKTMNVFDEMTSETSGKPKNLDKIETVNIDTFIKDILPSATGIELLLENQLENNLMSLVAPVDPSAPGMFKWPNNFSWSYNGEMADSIKEKVRQAGGITNAILRCSLAWSNYDDLDIHVKEPNGNHIYYNSAKRRHPSSGILDIDMNADSGTSRKPVENIVWTDKAQMQEGTYEVWVNQYARREMTDAGFTAEIEFEGKTKTFEYPETMATHENVLLAKFDFSRTKGIKFLSTLPESSSSKPLWNINTQQFHKTTMIMNSPNHWDGHATGNKHYFFILESCDSGQPVRGFYNEFLAEALTPHRKVFEVLGSKMKTDPGQPQLSGVGFSSTKRSSVVCKVTGTFTRIIKINF